MGRLKRPYNIQEFREYANVHLWKIVVFKLLEMMIVADNVSSTSYNCAINEFIVIGVRGNQIKTVRRIGMAIVRGYLPFVRVSRR